MPGPTGCATLREAFNLASVFWRSSEISASLDTAPGLGNLFDSAPGRAYLRRAAERDTTVGEVLKLKLDNWDGTTCTKYFEAWQEAVKSELGE